MNKKDEKRIANQLSEMLFEDDNLPKQDNTVEILSIIDSLENIEIKDRDERTPLINATCHNQKIIVKYLIDKGANLNAQDKLGYSSLHFAAQNGYIEIADMLLKNGASIDLLDAYGNTPLGKAVFYFNNDPEMIYLLLQKGANRFLENFNGVSPLELANSIGNYNISKYFI